MIRTIQLLGGLLLVAAVTPLFWVSVLDPDVLMHLKTGHWILVHRAIPKSDIFSANASGYPWTTHEWLWQVIAYATYRAAEWRALYALRIALVLAGVAALALSARRDGGSWIAALAASILLIGPLAAMAEIRPQLASYLFFAITILCLSPPRHGKQQLVVGQTIQSVQGRPRLHYALPPLFALWANIHGAVLLGFLIMACALADSLFRRHFALARRLAFLTVACAIAVLINPHGYDIYLFPFKVVGQESFRTQIYEWSRPDFSTPFLPFWISAGIGVIIGAAAWRRIGIFHWLLFAGFLLGAILSRRQIPFFALAAIPPVALGIDSLLARIHIAERQRWLPQLATLLLTCTMGPFSMTCYDKAGRRLGMGLAQDRFPEVAANRLANIHTAGSVLNDYNDGGFLIWRLYPEWPVTMDGRVDVYGPKLVQQYERVWAGEPGWQETLEKWHVQAILGRFEIARAMPQHNLYHELASSADWALVYWDNAGQLYLRRGAALDSASAKPFRVLAPGLSLKEMALRLKSRDEWLALGADLRRSISEVPENRRAAALLKQYEAAVMY